MAQPPWPLAVAYPQTVGSSGIFPDAVASNYLKRIETIDLPEEETHSNTLQWLLITTGVLQYFGI